MEIELQAMLARISPPDREAMEQARAWQARLAKPPGSLGKLEDAAVRLAGITGRLKNLIILSNGENISPEEVESALLSNDLVGEIVIAGEDNGLSARIFPDPDVVEQAGLSSDEVRSKLQGIIDEYNKSQPTYRAITALKVRKYPFIKNSTKKIIRAKMDVDEAPEA